MLGCSWIFSRLVRGSKAAADRITPQYRFLTDSQEMRRICTRVTDFARRIGPCSNTWPTGSIFQLRWRRPLSPLRCKQDQLAFKERLSPGKVLRRDRYSLWGFLIVTQESLLQRECFLTPKPEDHLISCSDMLPFYRISQHRYSAAFCNGGDFPLRSFMSKASVRGNITVFRDDIEATLAKGFPYILGFVRSLCQLR